MTDFVVDASVGAKWMFSEQHSEVSFLLLNAPHRRHAPNLVLAEFANIAWQRAVRQVLSARDAREMVQRFPGYFELHETSAGLIRAAFEYSLSFGITSYDALYVALATVLDIPLVTADRGLHRAVRSALGDLIIWIEDLPGALSRA